MINTFILAGVIKKVSISKPKDPKKGASAVIMVQYGVRRESTGNAVDFVNAVLIRVPSYRYPKCADILKEDARVEITGKLQGVLKASLENNLLTTELVADRIDLVGQVEEDAPEA